MLGEFRKIGLVQLKMNNCKAYSFIVKTKDKISVQKIQTCRLVVPVDDRDKERVPLKVQSYPFLFFKLWIMIYSIHAFAKLKIYFRGLN